MECTFTRVDVDRFCEAAKKADRMEKALCGYLSQLEWLPVRVVPRRTFERIASVTGARPEQRYERVVDGDPMDMIAYNDVLFYSFRDEVA